MATESFISSKTIKITICIKMANSDEDDDDDYMTMNFAETAPSRPPETSLQRIRREKAAAAERGKVKSKAQLEADAAVARENILSRSLMDDPAVVTRSKGFAMMAKMGFKKGDVLGSSRGGNIAVGDMNTEQDEKFKEEPNTEDTRCQAFSQDEEADERNKGHGEGPIKEPIKANIKTDKGGIGLDSERNRKRQANADAYGESEKRLRPDEVDPLAYRGRVARERELVKKERQVLAAQRLAESLHEDNGRYGNNDHDQERSGSDDDDGDDDEAVRKRSATSQPLKEINVFWRGIVRDRQSHERETRIKQARDRDMTARRPRYNISADEENDYDRMAMQPGSESSRDALAETAIGDEELDEDDDELDAFEALGADEKLRKVVGWLRSNKGYCFWCGCGYDKGRDGDWDMEGCPGENEDDH